MSGEHLEDLDGMKFSFVPYGQQLGDSCQQPCLFSTVHCAQNPLSENASQGHEQGGTKTAVLYASVCQKLVISLN